MLNIQETALSGVKLLTPESFEDDRGFVAETYSQRRLDAAGIPGPFLQENVSFSLKKGTVRGLHFQKAPHTQAKLIRVLKGRILDVAVDLRPRSPTYGQHVAVELTGENLTQLYIPKGFAHGFCTLTDDVTVLYKMDSFYEPSSEGGILWCDPDLKINWPVSREAAILSAKDPLLPLLKDLPPMEW